MNISVQKTDLEKLLYYIQSIVEKRTTMPVLSHCLFDVRKDNIEIFATDLEISYISQIPAISDSKGKFVLPAKKIYEIIKDMPSAQVQLQTEENYWINISSESSKNKVSFRLAGLNPEDFPNIQKYTDEKFTKINREILNEMIDTTIYAASTDETRYNLTGILFEVHTSKNKPKITMVATDGHRLAISEKILDEINLNLQKGIILPRKGLLELKKLLEKNKEIEIALKDNNFISRCDNSILAMRLIEGEFPDYNGVIPKTFKKHGEVNREEFISALRRATIMLSSSKFQGIKLSINSQKMQILTNNPDIGSSEEEIEIKFNGEKIDIGFNAAYLMDMLNSFTTDEVIFELNDELNQGVFKAKRDTQDDERCLAVIMPMRL